MTITLLLLTNLSFGFEQINGAVDSTALSQQATNLLNEAQRYQQAGNVDQALAIYKQSLAPLKQAANWPQYVLTLQRISYAYLYLKSTDNNQGIDYLQQALTVCQQYDGLEHQLATTWYYLGAYYTRSGNAKAAAEANEKALAIHKVLGNTKAVIQSTLGLADTYLYTTFNWARAKELYLEVIENETALAKPVVAFNAYYGLATGYNRSGDYETALGYAYQALEASKAPAISFNNKASVLSLIAQCNKAKGSYQTAITYIKQAINLTKANAQSPRWLAIFYNLLGSYLYDLGQYHEARAYHQQALGLLSVGSRMDQPHIANSHSWLSTVWERLGAYDSALHHSHACLETRKLIYGEAHERIANSYEHVGVALQAAGLADSALHYFQKALVIQTEGFEPSALSEVPGVKHFEGHLPPYQLIHDKAQALLALANKENKGQWAEQALAHYYLADSLLLKNRRAIQNEASKGALNSSKQFIYEGAMEVVWVLYQMDKHERYLQAAFYFMERSRAQLLNEALSQGEALAWAQVPERIVQESNRLREQYDYLQGVVTMVEANEPVNDQKLAEYRSKLLLVNNTWDSLQQAIEQAYAFFAERTQAPVKLADLKAMAVQQNAAIIEFYHDQQYLYLLGVNAKAVSLQRMPAKEIFTDLAAYRQLLLNGIRTDSLTADYATYVHVAHQLYSKLLAPYVKRAGIFAAKQHVFAIPYGAFEQIPLEGLLTEPVASNQVNYKQLPYFVLNNSISYAFSAELLLRNQKQILNNNRLLAYSNNQLPGTEAEVKKIADFFSSTVFFNEQASETSFKQHAEAYGLIHLAMHGEADTLNPYNAKLFFNQSAPNDDGQLFPYELYALDFSNRVVMLSACETGVGRQVRGEGTFSLARAFAKTGSPAIITTLWPVDDEKSASLVPTFYEAVAKGMPLKQALQTAKTSYINHANKFTAHPAYWSAYVQSGDIQFGSTFSGNRLIHTIAVILLLGLGIVGFAAYRKKQTRHKMPGMM